MYRRWPIAPVAVEILPVYRKIVTENGTNLKKFPNDGAPNYKKRNFAHFVKISIVNI